MRKLDLACGAACAVGFEGADIAPCKGKAIGETGERHPDVLHVFDLMQFPWPFEDASFDELRSSHHVEHIPQAYYTPNPRFPIGKNITAVAEGPHSVSLFLKFFSECHRILKPGGSMRVHCPHAHSDRAFQDPTHVRFMVGASFDYLDANWRKANGLEHAAYGATCDFPVALRTMSGGGSPEQVHALSLMSDAAKAGAVEKYWNVLSDLDVTLVKAKVAVATVVEAKEVAAATA